MADGGAAHLDATMVDLIIARARAHRGTFTAADIHARLPWFRRAGISAALSILAQRRSVALVGRVPARRGGGANLYSMSVSEPMPLVEDAAGVARRPDIDAADKAWRARIGAGARFNDPITATEAEQLTEIAGWQRS